MDRAPKLIGYEEPKLLPYDGRARLFRLTAGGTEVTTGESIMLFSAANEYLGFFESPQHAKVWCAAQGIDVADEIKKMDLAEYVSDPFAKRYIIT